MGHQDEFEAFRQEEESNFDARNKLFQVILQELEDANSARDKMEATLARNEIVFKEYESKAVAMKNELKELKKSMNNDPFVLVLIDGDGALFEDQYMNRGSAGGEDAARDLHTNILTYLRTLDDFEPHWKIQIRVYTKLNGLGKTYVRCGVVLGEPVYRSFVQGFNLSYELCEYIDAGTDKEGADNKLKSNLSLMYKNVHCRHIMLAISGDNSYNGPLRQYTMGQGKNQRITLIEARPFTTDQRPVAQKFRTTSFPTIFRKSDLVVPMASNTSTSFASAVGTAGSPPGSTFALPVSRNGTNKTAATAPTTQAQTGNNRRTVDISLNKQGHRIDARLPACDQTLLHQLKNRKLCNRHYLTYCGNPWCEHNHSSSLTTSEIVVLKHVARLSPCSNIECRDPLCVAAHRCPQGTNCTYGNICRFKPEMHKVDTNIHTTITMDLPG